ncbi:glycoside hydrolase family 32 protein [Microbacterium telephonicum]|uniref:Levanbiose-producing levanase n=1 Tax=Microbacterium telephonicum TaxID=1714841 RepID=A0A498C2N0_9MICO|nr:glycoside hydrolase family 32 protein [Microbacterium telephonicum]RLK46691.1 levanbiose-producing levanase [Microbacterium telephonicum]
MTDAPDPTSAPTHPRLRMLVVLLGVVAAVAVGVLVFMLSPRPHIPTPTPTSTSSPSEAPGTDEFARPSSWEQYRPSFHLTPPAHWMNDPQRPIYLDGLWHLYYLYNADYPTGNGTEWYHATSEDLVHWKNEGVAIHKYENGLGDILTGSAVIDEAGTAGFGPGAVVALVTQQDDGVQRQSLFGSTDGGYTFTPYPGNPVMENPGITDWRDPKIIRDESADRWVMVLAEGQRLGFYTSDDLVSWTYTSDFSSDALGLLECPDLFEMVDPVSGRRTWVLAASADGAAEGRATGLAYWTGSWDGERFTADDEEPQWLDDGADFYAAVTWDDPSQTDEDRLSTRYALGWINNWTYARDLPTTDWQGGALSTTRTIRLAEVDGRLRLQSTPIEALTTLEGDAEAGEPRVIEPGGIHALDVQPGTPAYRLRISFERPASGELRLRLADDDEHAVTVGYDATRGEAFIVRGASPAADFPALYVAPQTAPSPADAQRSADAAGELVTMDLLVDASSVEVFVSDGSSLTSAMYPSNTLRVTAEAVGASFRIDALSIAPMAIAISG